MATPYLDFYGRCEADARRRFNALADGGQMQMPLGETFMIIAGAKSP